MQLQRHQKYLLVASLRQRRGRMRVFGGKDGAVGRGYGCARASSDCVLEDLEDRGLVGCLCGLVASGKFDWG